MLVYGFCEFCIKNCNKICLAQGSKSTIRHLLPLRFSYFSLFSRICHLRHSTKNGLTTEKSGWRSSWKKGDGVASTSDPSLGRLFTQPVLDISRTKTSSTKSWSCIRARIWNVRFLHWSTVICLELAASVDFGAFIYYWCECNNVNSGFEFVSRSCGWCCLRG